jgi:hypothetical protein
MPNPTYFTTVDQIRRAADKSKGSPFFFSPGSMRAFGSRLLDGVHAGHFFITSETDHGRANRRYTVRLVDDAGDIQTVGQFRQYATAHAARKAMRRLQWLTFTTERGTEVPLPGRLQATQVDHEHVPYLVALAVEAYNAGATWARENPHDSMHDDEVMREKATNRAAFDWYKRVHGDPNDESVDHVYGLTEAFEVGTQYPFSNGKA